MKNRIFALLLSVLMLFSVFPLTTAAATNAAVVAENCSAQQGGYAYVYLRADNFVNVAVLDIELHYDSSVMSINYVSNGTLFSGASVSTNTSVPGTVKISAMSVKGMTSGASNSSNRMMTVCFKINATCPTGEYPIVVTVGDAYDNELNPASISSVSGTVTVNKSAATKFNLSSSVSSSNVKYGDVWTLNVTHSSSSSYAFASVDFHIEYDRDLFALESVELADKLKKDDAVYSINTSIQGLVIISYASTTAVTSSALFTVKLKAIADVDTTTDVTVRASNAYNDQLVAYEPYTLTRTITFVKGEVIPDYSDFTVNVGQLIVGSVSDAVVTLEGGAKVAAGDFVINYDPSIFSIESVSVAEEVTTAGGIVFINNNYGEGTIKFSYVNESGSFSTDMPLVKIKLTPLKTPDSHFAITTTGKGVCDINYADIYLDYVETTGCIFEGVVTEPTCKVEGYTTYTCSCGENFVTDITPTIDHSYGDWIIDKEATTTEEGSKHKECGACGDIVTESIPQLNPVVKAMGQTLEYNDMIYVKVIYDFVDIDLSEINITKDAGILRWTQAEFNALDEIAFDESHALVGLAKYPKTDYYYGKSEGIYTRYLADEYYYVGYVKLADGTYVYSDPILYGPKTYAYNMIGKNTTSAKTKALCTALLNYVSAAQKYFYSGITDAELANKDLTADQKALDWNIDELPFNLAPAIPAEKKVQADTTVFKRIGKNLRFEEMISLISIYQIDKSYINNAVECGTIFWTEDEFNALEGVPSIDNFGNGKKVPIKTYSSGLWCSIAPAVAPKDMADTSYYILGYVKHPDGTVSYSGVESYSFEQYIYNTVTKEGSAENMVNFAKWLYVYERAAEYALQK